MKDSLEVRSGKPFPLAVLNLNGADPLQTFEDGAGTPNAHVHPPVNYHAFTACTRGIFCRKVEQVPSECRNVVVLLRENMGAAIKAIHFLKQQGKRVAVTIKEAGTAQVAMLFGREGMIERFRQACCAADAAIATTHEMLPFYEASGSRRCKFIATPYPVEDRAWDFSKPWEQRRGILIGTRQPGNFYRNHQLALELIRPIAKRHGQPVTVINERVGDMIRVDYYGIHWRHCGLRWHRAQGWQDDLTIVSRRSPYPQYLELIARHRIVFQLDSGAVPGQVAGDALLARVPCVGGNGTTERLVFPSLCGFGRDPARLAEIADHLLANERADEEAVRQSHAFAREHLSFATVQCQLAAFFDSLRG